MRLQKFMAQAGIASRRASERLIAEGRVAVNGRTITAPGTRIDPERDRVTVHGELLRAKRRLYLALNKPPGVLCTRHDPGRRPTVLSLLPAAWTGLYPVGRLDRDTEGLLLLTNDGEFCLRLTHPRYGVPKTYHAAVQGRVDPSLLPALVRGVRQGRDHLKAERARLLRATHSHSLVELDLREGKYHEVRRLLAALGLTVTALRRTRIGPIRLGELPPGKWRVLTPREVDALRRLEIPARPSPAGAAPAHGAGRRRSSSRAS
ncbi:MAG: rRNA pseudouridine synthase [Verrucomicrobia bacterium]|nr:rRNA pseudouridine synthase [Verrucomicrobiota bacterium]